MATTLGSGSSQPKTKYIARLPKQTYKSFEEERVESPKRSPHRPQALLEPNITTITKMVFYHPMPVPREYSSLFFDRKEITAFLKTLNRCFKDYEIDDDTEKKERAAEYSAR
jgi:hypothetical protein